MTTKTLENISSEPCVLPCVVGSISRELSQVLSFEQNILDAELGIKNYRFPLGLTSGEVCQQLSYGEYFYGTPLQGQDFY